mmetsp:Transcript_70526/g.159544  ORF Transcript_70526/g.159544 Transcript_70526/m.159544 type:complete len:750 (+) Transcript_70526:603-2852(+)
MAGLALALCLHLSGLVLVLLDLLLYLVCLGPLYTLYKLATRRTTFAQPCGEKAAINGPGASPSEVWRSVEALRQGKFTETLRPGMTTLYQALTASYEAYAGKRAQGTRPLLRWQTDKGFKYPAKVFGETEWRSYADLGRLVNQFGAALRKCGVEPQPKDAENVDHNGILIYDETSADWMVCAQGAMSQSIVVATCYATLGIDAVVKAVRQGGVTAIVCNRKAVSAVLGQLGEMPSIKAVVYTDALCTPEEIAKDPEEMPEGQSAELYSLNQFIALGAASPCPPTPPTAESIAVIMYTSGSTGDPKGVLVKQSHILSMVAAVQIQLASCLGPGSVYLGYLPLAHILEMCAEFTYYCLGYTIGYADPKSLTTGPERAYPHGGLEEFKPNLMAGGPKVWEAIKAGAQIKVAKKGPLLAFLVNLAVKMKALAFKQHRFTPLFNILLKSFKALVGGRLKACLSGGGAISGEVQEWCRTALDCPLVQGYGLTETCAGATIQMPEDPSIGIAGTPLSSLEVVLHSEPEFKDADDKPYLSTDTVHANGKACAGRGEVWLRGNNVTAGYYKMPEVTAKDFDKDGWFHTGDIGMLTPGGALLIIDRKKNLVKLKGGEYVALERMNVAYNNSEFVNIEAGGVCSYAGAELDRSVVLAQCHKHKLLEVLQAKGAPGLEDGLSDADLCQHPEVQAAVLESFKKCAKAAGLTMLETVVGVHPLLVPWDPDSNGCLTATSKIISSKIYRFNAAELETIKKKGVR